MASFIDRLRAINASNLKNIASTSNSRNIPKENTEGVTFRDANEGEKTARQRISLVDPNGLRTDIFLVVPQKEILGYGRIKNQTYHEAHGGMTALNDRQKYDGPTKDVGYGEGGNKGTIMGAVLPNGEELTANGAKKYLENLSDKGIAIVDYEKPSAKQLHYGPDYVPGDIILNILGGKRSTGEVEYSYPKIMDNQSFQSFIKNLRNYRSGQ